MYRPINLRRTLGLLLVLVLVLTAFMPALAAAEEPIDLTFITWAETERIEAQKQLNEAFTAKYPNITVHIDKPANYRDKLYSMNAAGSPPDIFFEQEMLPPTTVAEGLCEPMDDYIANDSEFDKDSIFPALYDPFTIDGELYIIPAVTYVSVLFYNKDLFDAAGLAYPDENWTWDDYLDAAQKLTIVENGRTIQYGCSVDKLVNFYLPWVFSNGGDIVSADRSEFIMNSPEAVEAIDFLRDLVYTHKVSPEPATNVDQTVSAFTFQTGKVGMEVMGSWMITTYDKAPFNYGITMIPKSPRTGKAVPMAYPNGYAMAAKGSNKDAAWKYISFASSKEGQEILAQSGLGMPTSIEVANSDAFLNSSDKADMQVVVDSMTISKGPVTTAKWGEIGDGAQSVIGALGDEIFLNQRDTQEVLDEMKVKVDAIIATIGK